MKRVLKIVLPALVFATLVGSNLFLAQDLSARRVDCLGGPGKAGIWEGPWEIEAWCSDPGAWCIEANCWCFGADRHCLLQNVCNGQCIPSGG